MFIEEPFDVHRRIGQKVVLPCKVANRNGGRVQWTRDDFGLGQSRSTDFPRYTVIGNNLDSKKFTHVYRMRANNAWLSSIRYRAE